MRKDVFENLGELASAVELDHEVQLARSELYKLAKYAIKLHNMLKDASEEQGLEGWVSAEITKSAEGISKVYHSLEYEMKVGKDSSEDLGGMGPKEPEMPFESYKNTLGQKLTEHLKKKIVEGPKSGVRKQPANQANYFQQQRSGGAKKKPANQANYFQQQRSGGAAPAASTKEYHKANPNLPMDNPLNPYSPNFDIASLSPADQQKWKAQMATPQFKSRQQQKIIAYDQNAQTTTKGGATQDANAASDATQRPTNTGTAQQQGANQKISSPEPEVDKGFQPTHFHKGNVGNKIPLQYKNGKWFWQEDGVVKPWEGDVNDRGWLGSASVDGEIVNGTEVPYGDDETFADRQAAKPAAPAAPAAPGKVDPGLQQALNKGGQQPAPQQNVAQAPAAELPAVNKGGQQPAPQTVSAQTGQQPSNAGSTEAKKNSDGTYSQPGKPAQRFGRSNYNSRTQLPLTPNVEFTGRMGLKFKGKSYRFAGPDKMPPKTGIDISIPNKYQMIGSGNFRGKGLPVRLSGSSYYRLT